MAKFAVISHILPPFPSGQAVMLYRILSAVNPDAYYLIASKEVSSPGRHGADSHFRLPGRHYSLPPGAVLNLPNRFGLKFISTIVNNIKRIMACRKNILNILSREPDTKAIVACSGDLTNIPSGFLASRKAHIPFFAYIFDDYVYQWTGHYRLLAKLVASFIFKHCDGIIGANEFICAEYRRRYGVNSTLIRNPCVANETAEEFNSQWPAESGKIKIIYTGAVYQANHDCFRNLIHLLASMPKYHLELHIFTGQSREQLEVLGIKGERVFVYPHAPYDHMLEKQRQADILFLPLSFASPLREAIRTATPGKMGEYLASGRPVLAHVPADSFVAYYFKKHQCGWIADQNNPNGIAKEFEKIITAPELRAKITGNARRQAQLDFSPELAREQLLTLMQCQ
jgi:glycosyltransferase involved in cell wall biosynthesis